MKPIHHHNNSYYSKQEKKYIEIVLRILNVELPSPVKLYRNKRTVIGSSYVKRTHDKDHVCIYNEENICVYLLIRILIKTKEIIHKDIYYSNGSMSKRLLILSQMPITTVEKSYYLFGQKLKRSLIEEDWFKTEDKYDTCYTNQVLMDEEEIDGWWGDLLFLRKINREKELFLQVDPTLYIWRGLWYSRIIWNTIAHLYPSEGEIYEFKFHQDQL